MNFKPSATLETSRQRARIITGIRNFFHSHQYLEVETPILSRYAVTDVQLDSFSSRFMSTSEDLYLSTSPEYHMKRLLAAGYGPIFQITKAFRNDELGTNHNPEFTILEWYKPNSDHHGLMDEIDLLLDSVMEKEDSIRMSYRDLFQTVLEIDPVNTTISKLQLICADYGYSNQSDDRDELLDFLMTGPVENWIRKNHKRLFIYNYPKSQAALAKIDSLNPDYANRFELYLDGLEIANGFYELSDPDEQRRRFQEDNRKRRDLGKAEMVIDPNLIAALESGLPDCAGVALGLDRLVMMILGLKSITDIICFPMERA
ncbi:MAG: elongation factor P--(R)-beta-lysine ligase [Calditrichaeota bacterium]|nr:elongation factor P--(R)-beta-lysine ligase [Calditrichota bacterium]